MSQFSPAWCLIYTRSRQEKKVAGLLSKHNITCLLPLKKEKRKRKDRVKVIDEPLFPSYVFVQLQSLAEYTYSLNLEGVCYYVKFNNQIAKIGEQEIENIRLLASVTTGVEVTFERFKKGTEYLIEQGPLSGLFCEIIEYKGNHKLLVRVQILQRAVLMDLPADYLAEVTRDKNMLVG
jgi:transcriptional antiterminator RfaH